MKETIDTDIRFSIVPEWVLYSDISDKALRLYAILARYADNDTLQAFPSRALLAERANCSSKSVDRAVEELVGIGAIKKQQRVKDGVYQSSLFTVIRARVVSHMTLGVVSPVTRGRDTHDTGVGTPVSNITITNELEPLNYIFSRAKQMPKDWKPSDSVIDKFATDYPSLDFDSQMDAFADYHLSKGSLFKDWDRAFGTWCRNAVKFDKPRLVVHRQELKPPAELPGKREWVRALHDPGEHWECRPGEFGCS